MRLARLVATLLLSNAPLLAQDDGTRDPGFGSNGLVRFDFPVQGDPMDASAHDLVVEPDGRILVAGPLRDLDFAFLDNRTGVTRLLPDGSRDDGYGNVGKVRLDFMVEDDVIDGLDRTRIERGAGGEVYVATAYSTEGFRGPGYALARLRPGGALETAFGNGGILRRVFTDEEMRFADLKLQNDGKLLVFGDGADPSFDTTWFVVYRHLADGSLDPTFGAGGRVVLEAGNYAGGLAVQRDGKILLGGAVWMGTFPDDWQEVVVIRLLPSGAVDTEFGSGGRVTFDFGHEVYDVDANGLVVDAHGRIVVVGEYQDEAFVARLLPDGTLDPTFSGGGGHTFHYVSADPSSWDYAYGVSLQSDGKILAVGEFWAGGTLDPWQVAVARFLPNGVLDASFSGDGRAIFDLHSGGFGGSTGHQVALAHDGRIRVVGDASVGDSDDDFVVLGLRNRLIFADGFATGDVARWSASAP